MRVLEFEQRSDAWVKARLGRLCGSKAGDMLATLKGGGEAAGRRNLRTQLVLERLTGKAQEREFQSQAMRDGIEREQAARECYEVVAGRLVETVGYVEHDYLMAGYSPDGFVCSREGIVEAKAPMAATHLDYLKTGKVPKAYRDQVVHGLWITGAQWCDWFSYSPEFPDEWQIKLVRIERDEKEIAEYERQVRAFLAEVDAELQSLRTLRNTAGVLSRVAS